VAAFAGGQLLALRRAHPISIVEILDAAGSTAFALLGVGGLVFGVAALDNFLPLGTPGGLLSGGTIPLANLCVGIEVAGAFTLIFTEFVDQALLRRRSS